jgi:hypothetical protein
MDTEHVVLLVVDLDDDIIAHVRVCDLRTILGLCSKWRNAPYRSQERIIYGENINSIIKSYRVRKKYGVHFNWTQKRIDRIEDQIHGELRRRNMLGVFDYVNFFIDAFHKRMFNYNTSSSYEHHSD